jgi:hypothetical protein
LGGGGGGFGGGGGGFGGGGGPFPDGGCTSCFNGVSGILVIILYL